MTLIQDTLKLACETGFNVLIEGEHGTGKTALVREAFDAEFGPGNSLYFSCATMDGYVDLVGIPYAQLVDENTGERKLVQIRPELFNNNIKAVFADEMNRAPKAVLNALMELTQFKSINGTPTGVKVVFAATNPDEMKDDLGRQVYAVTPLDPAHRDRFHIHLNMPNTLDPAFFKAKYGPQVWKVVNEWYMRLDKSVVKAARLSPRRVDYAVEASMKGFSMSVVIPSTCNPEGLQHGLRSINVYDIWRKAVDDNDTVTMTGLVNGEQGFSLAVSLEASDVQPYLIHMEPDRIVKLLTDHGDKFNVRIADDDVRRTIVASLPNKTDSLFQKFAMLNSDDAVSTFDTSNTTSFDDDLFAPRTVATSRKKK